MSTNSPATPLEIGCYLDNHRGHYIARDAIDLAVGFGFIVGRSDAYVVAHYDDADHYADYPFEVITELCDEAISWLNSSPTIREISGQNMPPRRPEGAWWGFNDGDFGLYDDADEI